MENIYKEAHFSMKSFAPETERCTCMYAKVQVLSDVPNSSLGPKCQGCRVLVLHPRLYVQGSAKRWSPGCVNAAGKARRQAEVVSNSGNKIHQTY